MKKSLCLLIILIGFINLFGQATQKPDIILKVSGEEMKGSIVEVTDSMIRFTYVGEKAIYALKKSDIYKITFASGRTEVFTAPSQTATSTATTQPNAPAQTVAPSVEDPHNKVAILPFVLTEDGQNLAQSVSEEVQNECYAQLSKHSGVYSLVSPRATNVKLSKAGITRDNMLNYTMAELCGILGVEYIVDGMITINKTTQTNYGNATYNDKSKSTDGTNKSGNNENTKKSSGSASTYSTTTQNYQTRMDMKIYNNKSDIIFNQNRQSFWTSKDAYKSTLDYLLKRTPLYAK